MKSRATSLPGSKAMQPFLCAATSLLKGTFPTLFCFVFFFNFFWFNLKENNP